MRVVTVLLVSILLNGIAFYATAVLCPTEAQAFLANPMSNNSIGWYSGASGFGGLCSGIRIIQGWILAKYLHGKWQIIFYAGGITLFSGLQAIVSPNSDAASIAMAIILLSMVTGINVCAIATVQVAVPQEFIGIATGLIVCARSTGGSIGITVYETILNVMLKKRLTPDVAILIIKAGVSADSVGCSHRSSTWSCNG